MVIINYDLSVRAKSRTNKSSLLDTPPSSATRSDNRREHVKTLMSVREAVAIVKGVSRTERIIASRLRSK